MILKVQTNYKNHQRSKNYEVCTAVSRYIRHDPQTFFLNKNITTT
jgi:hypothetical protein